MLKSHTSKNILILKNATSAFGITKKKTKPSDHQKLKHGGE